MTRRILIVEDEASLSGGLRDVLIARGYEAGIEPTGDRGLAAARRGGWDLVLMDVMMPGLDGFEVLRRLRADGMRTPVILLTARGQEMDRVRGFDLGVDDYVSKPFSMLELLGRIEAVLRRSAPAAPPERLVLGGLELDLARYAASRAGAPVELPAKAYEVLRVLAARRGQAVGRDDLIEAVWGGDGGVNDRTLTNLVLAIRKAIEADPAAPRFLVTVHGVGYRLEAS